MPLLLVFISFHFIELTCPPVMFFPMSEVRGLICSSAHDGCMIIRQGMVDADKSMVMNESAKTADRLGKPCLANLKRGHKTAEKAFYPHFVPLKTAIKMQQTRKMGTNIP